MYHSTTKGKYHERNEDSLSIGSNFIIVADGMGGESSGDVASKIAVDTISNYLDQNLNGEFNGDIKEMMFNAIKQADCSISKHIDDNPDSYGMGTTVLLMVYLNESIFVAWCGDSRCYAYNGGHLRSLTKDHSYVQELIDANVISVEDSYTHPDNNLITRYVGGGDETCEPEYAFLEINDSDIIVLCSDGLSGYCLDKDINNIISVNSDLSMLPKLLTDLAIQHGSDDDITVVALCSDRKKRPRKGSSLFKWLMHR